MKHADYIRRTLSDTRMFLLLSWPLSNQVAPQCLSVVGRRRYTQSPALSSGALGLRSSRALAEAHSTTLSFWTPELQVHLPGSISQKLGVNSRKFVS